MSHKHEKPKPIGLRFYTRHRKLLARQAKKEGVSQAEIARRAVERYCG